MSFIQKLMDAEENKGLDKFNEVMSEDFVWIKKNYWLANRSRSSN